MKTQSARYWILAADVLWLFGALEIAIKLRYAGAGASADFNAHFEAYFLLVLVAVVVWSLLYFEMELDGFRGGWHFPAILSQLIVAEAFLMVALLAVAFLTRHYYSRLVLTYFAIFLVLGLVAVRFLARSLAAFRPKGAVEDRCVILGSGPVACELADKIASHPEVPLRVVGFLFDGEPETLQGSANCFGTVCTSVKTLQLPDLLAEQKIKKLLIAMDQANSAEVRNLIAACQKASIQVFLVPRFYDLYVSKAEFVEIDGLPLLSLRERDPFAARSAIKLAMDFVMSAAILLLISPVLLFAALFVYSKKGRAFRAELRCGKDGIPFWMYRLNADRYAPDWAPYERLLIRWSLTELPQLWNVLRGDMSLVGPRPESPERLKHYSDWQRQRLKVRPGVTGLAQVHGLREDHSSEDKARFDLQYILNWSPFLDLSLILQTVWTLLFRLSGRQPAPQRAIHFGATAGRVFERGGD